MSRAQPRRYHLGIALALTLTAALLMWWGAGGPWTVGLACWLVAINVVTFGYYGFDKSRAGSGGRRVPEVVLHALGALGGSPGALVGMKVFRHKTIKGPFRMVFWGIVVLQVGLIVWLIKLAWWP